jgi:hypothetical protein
LQEEINGLAFEGTKFTRLWSSEARFVVAGANDFSTLQQMEIFYYLSKFRLYNCIIVNKENDVINKESSRTVNINDVDMDMKLGVYTWFPYQSSDSCTEVNDITLLDSWVISAQGHFTMNTDLFPQKVTRNLKGCPMKAVVSNDWYFTTYYYVTHSNVSNVTEVHGMEMDLLMMVLKQMNMTFVHVLIAEDFEFKNGLNDNLSRAMIEKDVYIALGNLGTRILVDPFLESSNSYYMISYRWYVPCSDKYSRWSIFSLEVWLVLIISIVIVTISTTLLGRYSCTSEWHVYKTLASSLTNLWAVILGVSVSTMPRTPSLRSLFLAWVCFSVAFTTVFQAFLTTFLIDSGYKTPIQNTDELFASGIKLAYTREFKFIFEKYDKTELSKVERNRANCPSYEVCVDWAKYRKNVSILMVDRVAEEMYASGSFIGENSEPLVCMLEDGVVYFSCPSMLMFHGDPLMKRINEIISRVVAAGLYNFWISLIFQKNKLLTHKIGIVHPPDGYYSFNLYHLQPAFYLLLIGWFLSALCFMVELLYNYILKKEC